MVCAHEELSMCDLKSGTLLRTLFEHLTTQTNMMLTGD